MPKGFKEREKFNSAWTYLPTRSGGTWCRWRHRASDVDIITGPSLPGKARSSQNFYFCQCPPPKTTSSIPVVGQVGLTIPCGERTCTIGNHGISMRGCWKELSVWFGFWLGESREGQRKQEFVLFGMPESRGSSLTGYPNSSYLGKAAQTRRG